MPTLGNRPTVPPCASARCFRSWYSTGFFELAHFWFFNRQLAEWRGLEPPSHSFERTASLARRCIYQFCHHSIKVDRTSSTQHSSMQHHEEADTCCISLLRQLLGSLDFMYSTIVVDSYVACHKDISAQHVYINLWRSYRESNPDLRIRSRSFYPLNYSCICPHAVDC